MYIKHHYKIIGRPTYHYLYIKPWCGGVGDQKEIGLDQGFLTFYVFFTPCRLKKV